MQMLNGGGAVTSCSLVPVQALGNDNASRWLGAFLKRPDSQSYPGSNGSSVGRQRENENGSSSGVAALVSFSGELREKGIAVKL